MDYNDYDGIVKETFRTNPSICGIQNDYMLSGTGMMEWAKK